MKNHFRLISNTIDKINETIGKWISWITVVLVLTTGVIVLLRYQFQIGSIALQESIIYFNAMIFTLGAAYTLKEQGHVRVDIFYSKMSERNKALVDLSGTLIFLIPVCIFIIWMSWNYVATSWRIGEKSAEIGGLPFIYLLKTLILFLPALLLLQSVSELLKAYERFTDPSNNNPGKSVHQTLV